MMEDYSDPKRTVLLIDELVSLSLTDAAFSRLHHFKEPEKISSHRRYCAGLAEEDGLFRTNNNRLVQRRLELVLRLLKAGEFKNLTPVLFEKLADISMIEYPNDPRPLAEQFAQLSGCGTSAA